MNLKIFFILFVAVLMVSCASSYSVSSPYGVKSKFKTLDKKIFEAELLQVNKDSVWLFKNYKIYAANLEDFELIHTNELEAQGRGTVLFGSGVVSLFLGGLTYEDSKLLSAGFLSIGSLAILSGANGVDKFKFRPPLKKAVLGRLQHYCRYPNGLSKEQIESLLEYYNQAESLQVEDI